MQALRCSQVADGVSIHFKEEKVLIRANPSTAGGQRFRDLVHSGLSEDGDLATRVHYDPWSNSFHGKADDLMLLLRASNDPLFEQMADCMRRGCARFHPQP
jgi:hypothetical protein